MYNGRLEHKMWMWSSGGVVGGFGVVVGVVVAMVVAVAEHRVKQRGDD